MIRNSNHAGSKQILYPNDELMQEKVEKESIGVVPVMRLTDAEFEDDDDGEDGPDGVTGEVLEGLLEEDEEGDEGEREP